MTASLLEERREFAASLRRLLAAQSFSDRVRSSAADDGYDRQLWRRLVDELGVAGIGIDEVHGGAGLSQAEVLVAFEETGRVLAPVPLLATVAFAVNAVQVSDDVAAMERLLPRFAAGSTGTVVFADRHGRVTGPTGVAASRSGDAWRLDGTAATVLHVEDAAIMLVFATAEDQLSLFEVAVPVSDIPCTVHRGLDLTRDLADVDFVDVPARLVGSLGSGREIRSRLVQRACLAISAEAVGGAQRCLEMSVDHAQNRHQFGRPIGSFQAVKHLLADMAVGVETARVAASRAVAAWESGGSDGLSVISAVKAYCTDVFLQVAHGTVHVHGGTGFTWEHDAHLYLRRAKLLQQLAGSSAHHRAVVAQCLGFRNDAELP